MIKISFFLFLYIMSQFKINNKNFTNGKKLSEIPTINLNQNFSQNNSENMSYEQHIFINYKTNKNIFSSKIVSSSITNKKNNKYGLNINSLLKKNLLIGTIINFGWEKIALFFKSFQRAQIRNCDCVMFIHNISLFSISKLKSYGVIIYKIPDKYTKMKVINYRWKLYADFLNHYPKKYNLVFHSDIRDVVFQQDIFNFYNSTKPFLGLAIEDGLLTQKLNKKWILDAYGEELFKTIQNERIICLGTLIGTQDKFKEFSYILWKNINLIGVNKVIDQTIGNYLIYHDKLFNNSLIKSYNSNGPIITIGLTKRENIKLDGNNNILNGELKVASVIHQYDRKADIVQILINKYCPETKKYFFVTLTMCLFSL